MPAATRTDCSEPAPASAAPWLTLAPSAMAALVVVTDTSAPPDRLIAKPAPAAPASAFSDSVRAVADTASPLTTTVCGVVFRIRSEVPPPRDGGRFCPSMLSARSWPWAVPWSRSPNTYLANTLDRAGGRSDAKPWA